MENELKPLRQLSKFEKDSLNKALKNQKENKFKKQIVQGKEFKGDSFISEPKIIQFLDFEVGIKNILQFTLTNISWTINSFKILEIEDKFANQFEVIYTPAGQISAGLNSKVIIKFFPEIREDIDTFLPLITETGPVNIPIKCRYKRSDIVCDNNLINFGNVIYGENKTSNLILRNQGGLSTNIFIKNKSGITLYDKTENMSMYSKKNVYEEFEEDDDYKLMKELKMLKSYKIEGYSNLVIPITYEPNEVKSWDTKIILYFENVIDVPQFYIYLKGNCVELPIEIKDPIINYKICLLDHIFRDKIIFFNKSKKPMKIQVSMPYETSEHFIMNPNFGYIQGESEFHMWLKIKVDKNMLRMCKKFFIKENKLKIPMKLIPSEQKLPVEFEIRLEVTNDILEIEPNIINFDKIYENSGKEIELTLKNKSNLPQEIYFCKKPQNISFEPETIPIIVKPLENLKIKTIYRGFQSKTDNGFIVYKKITGNIGAKEEKIFYQCKVIKPPLKLKTSRIDFPCLELNEKSNQNVEIKNVSKENYICEIINPNYEISGIKIVPLVFKINSDSKLKFNIEYTSKFRNYTYKLKNKIEEDYKNNPEYNLDLRKKMVNENENKEEVNKESNKEINIKKNLNKKELEELKKKEEEENNRKLEEERIKLEREEKLEKEFNEKEELRILNGKYLEKISEEGKSQHYNWLIPIYFKDINIVEGNKNILYLEINTISIYKKLVSNKYEIDFGEIAIGFRKLENIQITNNSNSKYKLHMNILPLYSGFNVINALREIKPGETKNLVCEFQPITKKDFKEELVIYSKESKLTINLKGKSLLPEIEIDLKNGILDMGSLIMNDTNEKLFKIKNITNFKLNFEIKIIKSGANNNNNLDPFIFKPYKGEINSKEEKIISVIFRPDKISENYFKFIKIKIPKQKNPKFIFIYGKCFERQAYMSKYIDIENEFKNINYKDNLFEFLNFKNINQIFCEENNNIYLKFDNIDEVSNNKLTKKLIIGSCKLNDSKLEKATNYEINLIKDDNSNLFTIDQTKGSINGNYIIININYQPPEKDGFIEDIASLQGIGKWFECKGTIKISGGYNPNGKNDIMNFNLFLKAFMNHI